MDCKTGMRVQVHAHLGVCDYSASSGLEFTFAFWIYG